MPSDLAALNRSVSLSSAAHDFTLVAKTLMAAGGRWDAARAMAGNLPSLRAREVIEKGAVSKAAVSAMTMTSAAALVPYRELVAGFFGSMSEFSAYSRIYNAGDFYRVPLRTIIAVLTSAPVGYSVSELAAKPLSSGAFATTTLESQKVISDIVITNELARSAGQAAMLQFDRELRRAASVAVDAKFLALMAATPGITSNSAAGGPVTAANVSTDLVTAANALTVGADSRLYWIVSPKLFKTLSLLQGTGGYLMQGGKIGSVTVAPSDAATTTATLLDARQIATEIDTVTLDSSQEGAIETADNPTSGNYHLISFFQNNLTALRCEVWFGAVAMRSTSVALITGYAA
jgi:HK97 family phage major capsid protein